MMITGHFIFDCHYLKPTPLFGYLSDNGQAHRSGPSGKAERLKCKNEFLMQAVPNGPGMASKDRDSA